MKKIKLKMSVISVAVTALVIACVIIFNAIVGVITSKFPLKIDLTQNKIFEFSQQTKEVMKKLDVKINAYALFSENLDNEYVENIKDYLNKYKQLSKNFNVEYIDPYTNPAFAKKYSDGSTDIEAGSIIVESDKKFEIVSFSDIYSQDYDTGEVSIDMERKLTNAIMAVNGQLISSKIYYTTGHEEYSVKNLLDKLQEQGNSVEEINISIDGIPEDAGILFSMAPMKDYTESERDALDAFLDKGGKFVLFSNPGMVALERLDAYLLEWGIKLNYDFVIEEDSTRSISSAYGAMPVPEISEHAITKSIVDSSSPLVMPFPMSLSVVKSANSATVTSLLETSDKSYGKVNFESDVLEKEEGDIFGPLCIAAISEHNQTKGKVLVIGSVESQSLVSEGSFLNEDFYLNAVSYLTGGKTDTGIRAKKISPEVMVMSEGEKVLWAILLQYVIPFIIVLAGLFVWLKRRFK